MADTFGDRMKGYERAETDQKFMPYLPIYARLDGRGFSKFTRGLERPYDSRMSDVMRLVTQYLVRETGASVGYTQSDEISLCWKQEYPSGPVMFAGKKQKLVSTLAALATVKFKDLLPTYLPEKADQLPTFDTRVFQVPDDAELYNQFLWRVQDAIKNSIQMAAQHYCSHSKLQGLNKGKQLELLEEHGIVWGEYPRFFKEGIFLNREGVIELEEPFKDVTNKADFLLRGEEPKYGDQ